MAQMRREQIDDQFILQHTLTAADSPQAVHQKFYSLRNALGQFSPSKQTVFNELLRVIQPILTQPVQSHAVEHIANYHFLLKNLGKPDIEFLQKASRTLPNLSQSKLKIYEDYYQAIQKQFKLHTKPESETIAGIGIITTVFGVFSYLISDNPWFSGGMILLGALEWSRNEDCVQAPEWTLIPGIARSTAAIFHPIRRKEKAEEYRLLKTDPIIPRQ